MNTNNVESSKVMKQGNSIIVTLPNSLGVKEGEEFYVVRKENGFISLIPKIEDHFANVTEGEYHMPEEDVGYAPAEESSEL